VKSLPCITRKRSSGFDDATTSIRLLFAVTAHIFKRKKKGEKIKFNGLKS